MDTPVAIRALTLFCDVELGRRARAALQSVAQVWIDAAEVPHGVTIDVLVVDKPLRKADVAARLQPTLSDEFGLIVFGRCPEADVELGLAATEGEIAIAVRLLAQIVELRRQQARGAQLASDLAELAATDPLTGLANRRAWDTAIARLSEGVPRPLTFCIALFDLDHFKVVNDRYGHLLGDAVLQQTAARLRNAVRDCDLVARLGGDEFAVLLTDLDEHLAPAVVERIRTSLTHAPVDVVLQPITCSAGAVVYAAEIGLQAVANWFEHADNALLAAKAVGRNRTVMGNACSIT